VEKEKANALEMAAKKAQEREAQEKAEESKKQVK